MKRKRALLFCVSIFLFLASCSAFEQGGVAPSIGTTQLSAIDQMAMVYIPQGTFKMGSENGLVDERPVHEVFLYAYWIDQTEVTNEKYSQCVAAGDCELPSVTHYYDDPAFALHPVVYVSWNDAGAYCSWAGRRLPTEAEWEKAAAWDPYANRSRTYAWGDEFDCSLANLDDETTLSAFVVEGGPACDGFETSAPVGSFTDGISAYGAMDMTGNAWEWVFDGYLETDPYLERPSYYAISPAANPTGPHDPPYQVMRGGAWTLNFGMARASYRLWFGAGDSYDGVGFRCALGTKPFELNP